MVNPPVPMLCASGCGTAGLYGEVWLDTASRRCTGKCGGNGRGDDLSRELHGGR